MIKLYVSPAELAWLEDLALKEAVDHETGQPVTHPFASDILTRKNMPKRNWRAWRYKLLIRHIWH